MINRLTDTKAYIVDSLQVTAGFLIIVVVIKLFEPHESTDTTIIARSLLNQASQWYSLSMQDKQPLYAMQHANYAVAYLNAARHTASDIILEQTSGLDIHKLYKSIDENHRQRMKETAGKLLPKTKLKGIHTQAAWIS